jgi:hypothetical protein
MDQLPREIIIGGIGSILGALIVYFGQSGLQLTKKARQKAGEVRRKEVDAWKSKKLGIRQDITNYYLFSILRYLFLGNFLWLMPEFVLEPGRMLGMIYQIYDVDVVIVILSRGGALLCFFLGLGRILRYLRLRALYDVPEDEITG